MRLKHSVVIPNNCSASSLVAGGVREAGSGVRRGMMGGPPVWGGVLGLSITGYGAGMLLLAAEFVVAIVTSMASAVFVGVVNEM